MPHFLNVQHKEIKNSHPKATKKQKRASATVAMLAAMIRLSHITAKYLLSETQKPSASVSMTRRPQFTWT